MTNEEWQHLCRYAKNKGTFYELITAIKIFIGHVYREKRFNTPQKFINHFSYNAVKDWYIGAFELDKKQKVV